MISVIAFTCSPVASSSTVRPTRQLPLVTRSGQWTYIPTRTPAKLTESILPSRMLNTANVQQSVVPSGLSGGALAVAHGQTIEHVQLATYRPSSFQDIASPFYGTIAATTLAELPCGLDDIAIQGRARSSPRVASPEMSAKRSVASATDVRSGVNLLGASLVLEERCGGPFRCQSGK